MKVNLILKKLHWVLSVQFGLNLRTLGRSFIRIPRYLRDWIAFRKLYSGRMIPVPCLHDSSEEGGGTESEYFWQDLLVAQWIHSARPVRHVDVGSRVDGFVSHVASFRDVEVFDVRPIYASIPRVTFRRADLMHADPIPGIVLDGYCDSISCLHAIEHFGLGRYGDPIDRYGYKRGIENLARMLTAGGVLYLGTPLGRERVEFNANWVFDPRTILACATAAGLRLSSLTVVGPKSLVRDVVPNESAILELARSSYRLGIFVFRK